MLPLHNQDDSSCIREVSATDPVDGLCFGIEMPGCGLHVSQPKSRPGFSDGDIDRPELS
jgi:hypothetical protein